MSPKKNRLAISILFALLMLIFSAETFAKTASETVNPVIADLAGKLGCPVEQLLPETDLALDLHFDRMMIFEAVSALCEEYHVELPEQALTRVNEIVIWVTKKSPPAANMRGGGKAQAVAVQRVFFATNRQKMNGDEPLKMFGKERSTADGLSLGFADVSIPPGHKEGQVETPLLNIRLLRDPGRHFMIRELRLLSEDTFFSMIPKLLGTNGDLNDGIVVFIHGYNTSFGKVVLRTAQLAYDSGFMGAPIAFSWPSDDKMLAYSSDREDVTWSIQYIEDFLTDLRRKIPGRKIHLIAHSMGSQGLIGALNQMALEKDSVTRFDSVTLAAPDFDADYFARQVGPRISHLAASWLIYASDKDSALDFSSTLNAMKRLGQPVTPVQGMQVVDASGLEVTPWNVPQSHSYYATKKRVIDDLVGFWRGRSPAERKLLARKNNDVHYWSFRGK